VSRIVIPSIQDVKASHLPSGTIRSGGQLADLVYPGLHRGCVLAMPFSLGATGNTSLDVSGYNNNGTLTNGPTWQGRDGMLFDGMGYVDAGNGNSLNITDRLTLSVWLNPQDISIDRTIIGRWDNSAGDRPYILYTNTAGTVYLYTNTAGIVLSTTTSNVVLNHWQHIVATYDGATQKLYYDGIGEDSDPQTGDLQTPSMSLKIGKSDNNRFFDGLIDDPRIYSRALSAEEAAQLFTAGRPGVTGGIYQARTRPKVFAFAGIGGATPWRYIRRQSQIIGSGLGV